MPLDQDYVKAMEIWDKSMLLNIEDSIAVIEDCKRMVELNQKKIQYEQELLDYNSKRHDKAMGEFKDYLRDNE